LYRNLSGWTKDVNLEPSYYGNDFENEVRKMKTMVEQCLRVLESVISQLKIIPESLTQLPTSARGLLHPIVSKTSGAAFARGEHDNAVLAALV
jgi:hypothetical protein